MILRFLGPLFFLPLLSMGADKLPKPLQETELNYQVRLESLQKGGFQYFFKLLRPTGDHDEILKPFLPLDAQKLWDPSEGNHLALTKLNYLLPIDIGAVNEERFISQDYLQKTIPDYPVTKIGEHFHVGGSFLTPEFRLSLVYLNRGDPMLGKIQSVDLDKVRSGKMKVFFQHQDRFGRVMFFKTAKMASAATIYEESSPGQTLVTQYILSNVINVPAKALLKREMIKNMQTMVLGSRKAVRDF